MVFACGGGSAATATPTPTPTSTPTSTAAPTLTPTPVPTPTPIPTPKFAATDTVVVGGFQLKIAKVAHSTTAVADLAGHDYFITVVDNFIASSGATARVGSTLDLTDWKPAGASGPLLGVRVSVLSGKATDLANLAVTLVGSNGSPWPVLAAVAAKDGKSVIWFFDLSESITGPFILAFPSGETAALPEA